MNKPQIRFKGFDEGWKSYILKDACTSFKYGLNAAASPFDGKHKYLRITDIDDTSRQYCKDDLTSPQIDSLPDEFRLKPNDIVFARTGASVGKSYLYNQKDGEVYWAGFLIRASVNDLFDSDFVFQTTLTSGYWDYINLSSQRSGQPGVNAEQYAQFPFYAPIKSEQVRIGQYLKSIDNMITEVEREIIRLEKMKQASLQKMFPRPGETTPEIRFAGFTAPWKEKKISDCASFNRGQGYTKNDLKESGYPIFLYGRLYTKYSTYVDGVDTYSFVTANSVISKGNEVVMPSSGETAEDIAVAAAILSKGIILGGGLIIIVPKEEIDQIFLALSLTFGQAHYELAKKAQGKSVVHIYNDDIGNLNILFPSLEEQKAIGDYFRNLDSLLSAKRQKLVKLRNIKQACLDKMFVNSEDI